MKAAQVLARTSLFGAFVDVLAGVRERGTRATTPFRQNWPTGMAWWRMFKKYLDKEVVDPRDRSVYGLLAALGIQKGEKKELIVKTMKRCLFVLCLMGFLSSGCASNQEPAPTDMPEPRVETVLSREEQSQLTPDAVLEMLKEGNRRFVSETVTARAHSKQVRAAATGQFPKAIILSCVDSRVPVEDVFDRGIGDVFVARVAGNFENTDILGSMEFATKVSGARLVLVLGHYQCGAVKAAIDSVELGNITGMVGNIVPATEHFASYDADKSSQNEEFVRMVTEQNVRVTIKDIREQSPILQGMEENGEIGIAGAVIILDE